MSDSLPFPPRKNTSPPAAGKSPSSKPAFGNEPICRGCGKPLSLRGITRLWPLPLDAHRYRPPLTRAVAEVVCVHCRYPHYVRCPTSAVTPNAFGLPEEVADRIVSYAVGRLSGDHLRPIDSFRELARFYSLVHQLCLHQEAKQSRDGVA